MTRSYPRPWLAVLLAVIYPGLGHVYLREWGRALLWLVLTVATVTLAVPGDLVEGTSITDPNELLATGRAVWTEVPTIGLVTLALVVGFNVVDAYALARSNGPSSEGQAEAITCPHCGKDLDADLDFCHWCTTRLGGEGADEQ